MARKQWGEHKQWGEKLALSTRQGSPAFKRRQCGTISPLIQLSEIKQLPTRQPRRYLQLSEDQKYTNQGDSLL